MKTHVIRVMTFILNTGLMLKSHVTPSKQVYRSTVWLLFSGTVKMVSGKLSLIFGQ